MKDHWLDKRAIAFNGWREERLKSEQGYFLAEVVVTTFIVGVLLACLWPIWSEMKRLHEQQQRLSEAIRLMQNTAEEQRNPCHTAMKNRRTVLSQIYRSYQYQVEYQCRPFPGLSAWSVQVRWTNQEGKVEQERLEGLIFHASTGRKKDLPTLR